MTDGNRTRDLQIHNPDRSHSKPKQNKQIAASDDAGRSAGRSDERSEGGITDPELAALVAVWPMLSEPIRRAVSALIQSAAAHPSDDNGGRR